MTKNRFAEGGYTFSPNIYHNLSSIAYLSIMEAEETDQRWCGREENEKQDKVEE